MATIRYILFVADYMTKHYGGSFTLLDNILYFKNGIDEFYCDLKNKTEKNKIRFWHKYESQDKYHRQIDRKSIVAGLYQCFTHKNKYNNIKYDRQERIRIQAIISEEWQKYNQNNNWKEVF